MENSMDKALAPLEQTKIEQQEESLLELTGEQEQEILNDLGLFCPTCDSELVPNDFSVQSFTDLYGKEQVCPAAGCKTPLTCNMDGLHKVPAVLM